MCLSYLINLCSKKLIEYENILAVEKEAYQQNKLLLVHNDFVYDVTRFLNSHPGGAQTLIDYKGKSIDGIFEKYHYPKGPAKSVMKKYKVGIINQIRNTSATARNNIKSTTLTLEIVSEGKK